MELEVGGGGKSGPCEIVLFVCPVTGRGRTIHSLPWVLILSQTTSGGFSLEKRGDHLDCSKLWLRKRFHHKWEHSQRLLFWLSIFHRHPRTAAPQGVSSTPEMAPTCHFIARLQGKLQLGICMIFLLWQCLLCGWVFSRFFCYSCLMALGVCVVGISKLFHVDNISRNNKSVWHNIPTASRRASTPLVWFLWSQ